MKLQSFLLINAILFVPFGLVMLLIPGTFFQEIGVNLDADGTLMARVSGSALFSFGLICFIIRKELPSAIGMKAVLVGNIFFHAFDSISTFIATNTGVMNSLGWMFFSLHLVLTVGFLYYLIKKNQKA